MRPLQGQDWEGREKLLSSVLCSGRQACRCSKHSSSSLCLPKSLASSTNFCVLLRTFSESAKAFRYRSCNHDSKSRHQTRSKTDFLSSLQSLRNHLKITNFTPEGLHWAPAFSLEQANPTPLRLINQHNCNPLKRPRSRPEAFRAQLSWTPHCQAVAFCMTHCAYWDTPFSTRQVLATDPETADLSLVAAVLSGQLHSQLPHASVFIPLLTHIWKLPIKWSLPFPC